MKINIAQSEKEFIQGTDGSNKSLDEINGSVHVPKNAGFWKTLMGLYRARNFNCCGLHGSW